MLLSSGGEVTRHYFDPRGLGATSAHDGFRSHNFYPYIFPSGSRTEREISRCFPNFLRREISVMKQLIYGGLSGRDAFCCHTVPISSGFERPLSLRCQRSAPLSFHQFSRLFRERGFLS